MRDSLAPVSALGGLTPCPVSSLLSGLDDDAPLIPLRVDSTDFRFGGDPVDLTTQESGASICVMLVSRDPQCL